MASQTVNPSGERKCSRQLELERRLSCFNLDVLDSNYRRLSLSTRLRDQNQSKALKSSTEVLKAASIKEAASMPISCGFVKVPFADSKEAYKSNVMLIIRAARKCRIAYKEDESYLVQAAANIITSTPMLKHK